jgi:serine/threonine-protein kinase
LDVDKADRPAPFTDKYDVERVLGRGGMGTVFEARHSRLGQRVAIKVLGAGLRAHPELVARFEREARAASALSSLHAVKVFDFDQTEDGTPFIVMEMLDGRDLSKVVEREGPQPIGTAVRWIIEACDALAEAHRLGIIHRDIKPSNLLLCRETGSVKVLDFGIAKHVAAKDPALTGGLAPLGTPQYMSPEQARCAADIDARTDIWSLGVTLYELVCGRPPFNHDVPQACIAAIVADPISDPREHRPDLPDDLALTILRALAKDPADRFQTVEELVLELAPHADARAGAGAAADDGSARVLAFARRTVPRDLSELDSDAIEQVPKALEEGTVPPAVSRADAQVTRRARRIRSSIAVASAAALGLATLVATPRCARTRLDSPSSTNVTSTVSSLRENSANTPAPFATPSASEPELEPEPSSSSPVPVETLPRPTTSQTPRPVTKTPPKGVLRPLPTSSAARITGAELPVHGGISSPGF